jgi:hypothetical protein
VGLVGSAVGSDVGSAVGVAVGAAEGFAVGPAVGLAVGDAVGGSGHWNGPGQVDPGPYDTPVQSPSILIVHIVPPVQHASVLAVGANVGLWGSTNFAANSIHKHASANLNDTYEIRIFGFDIGYAVFLCYGLVSCLIS